jgi:hypothetical protein
MNDKYKKLQAELLEKDTKRDDEKRLYKIELDARYQQNLEELRHVQDQMESEQVSYEAKLRNIFNKAQERETIKLMKHKERLQAYERDLYYSFEKILDGHFNQLEREYQVFLPFLMNLRDCKLRSETLQGTVSKAADESAERMNKIMADKMAYEAEVEKTLGELRSQLQILQEEHQIMSQEIMLAQTQKIELEAEYQYRIEQQTSEAQRQMTEFASDISKKILEKDK